MLLGPEHGVVARVEKVPAEIGGFETEQVEETLKTPARFGKGLDDGARSFRSTTTSRSSGHSPLKSGSSKRVTTVPSLRPDPSVLIGPLAIRTWRMTSWRSSSDNECPTRKHVPDHAAGPWGGLGSEGGALSSWMRRRRTTLGDLVTAGSPDAPP